jgi:hypothetical protein
LFTCLCFVENAFGRLVAMWQIFQRPITLQPDKVDKMVLACCALQNYLLDYNMMPYTMDTDAYVHNGTWRAELNAELFPLQRRSFGNNVTRESKQIQQTLKNWFCTIGSVHWQDRMIQFNEGGIP